MPMAHGIALSLKEVKTGWVNGKGDSHEENMVEAPLGQWAGQARDGKWPRTVQLRGMRRTPQKGDMEAMVAYGITVPETASTKELTDQRAGGMCVSECVWV